MGIEKSLVGRLARHWLSALTCAAILLVAFWLRFWQLDHQILIDDEWHALIALMQRSYSEIFLSFGQNDYSIPLTLFFKWLADTVGLTEWRMRVLPILAGFMLLFAVPWVLRPWLTRNEQLVLIALMAVSPLLIHFSRYIRPYSLTVLLSFLCVVSLWRWWHEGHRGWAVLFFITATLGAWLHPLTLLFTGPALFWFGCIGIRGWRRNGGFRDLKALAVLGGVTAASCALVILPPLLADPSAMEVKSGVSQIEFDTLTKGWELIVGTANSWFAIGLFVVALIGGRILARRDFGFLAYWLFLGAVAVSVIVLLKPAYINHALVLVRYTLTFQPFALALIAVGLVWFAGHVAGFALRDGSRPAISLALAFSLVAGLYLSGPLPNVYAGINQFTNHLRFHFDYDFEGTVYRERMASARLPDVYKEMKAEPGSWVLVEAPWHLESHASPLSEYQRQHQMPVRIGMMSGLCIDWMIGEVVYDSDMKIRLSQFVHLANLLFYRPEQNRFLVFHRRSPFDDVRRLPSVEPCIEEFRETLGEPWHESREHVVFRLEGRSP